MKVQLVFDSNPNIMKTPLFRAPSSDESLSTTPIDTNVLVSLILANDKAGFELLYSKYSSALFGVILKIVVRPEIAEDILQDSFIKIWLHISDFDPQRGSLFTWMLNIARNQAIDYLRSSAHKQSLNKIDFDEMQCPVSQHEQGGKAGSEVEMDDIKQHVILQLDAKYAEVIDLIFYTGWTQIQAAKMLQIPLGTIKTRTRKALNLLKLFYL